MQERRQPIVQAAAVLAVAAAAASLVAGLGAYLFVRFTQHRGSPDEKQDPNGPRRKS